MRERGEEREGERVRWCFKSSQPLRIISRLGRLSEKETDRQTDRQGKRERERQRER